MRLIRRQRCSHRDGRHGPGLRASQGSSPLGLSPDRAEHCSATRSAEGRATTPPPRPGQDAPCFQSKRAGLPLLNLPPQAPLPPPVHQAQQHGAQALRPRGCEGSGAEAFARILCVEFTPQGRAQAWCHGNGGNATLPARLPTSPWASAPSVVLGQAQGGSAVLITILRHVYRKQRPESISLPASDMTFFSKPGSLGENRPTCTTSSDGRQTEVWGKEAQRPRERVSVRVSRHLGWRTAPLSHSSSGPHWPALRGPPFPTRPPGRAVSHGAI